MNIRSLLKRAGFSKKESEELVDLLSSQPIPVIEIRSRSTKEASNIWLRIYKGEILPFQDRQVERSIYQCILLGKILAKKKWIRVANPKEMMFAEKEFECVVYKKVSSKWLRIIIMKKPNSKQTPFVEEVKNDRELQELNKVVKFIKMLVK